MNFFLPLFRSKLDAMRAAAPRATLHLLHESNGFFAYLNEAAAAQKASQLGKLTNYAEDVVLDDPVEELFIPLEHMMKFVEEVTSTHSVALMDVILADRVHAARYQMYAYSPRKQTRRETPVYPYTDAEQAEIDEESRKAMPVEEKDADDGFWS